MPRFGPATRRAYTQRPGNVAQRNHWRFSVATEPESRDPLTRDARLARLEATLFLADEPLTLKRLVEVAELNDVAEAKQQIEKLRGFYDADGSPFQIEELAGGFQLLTRASFHTWLLRLRRTGHDLRPLRRDLPLVSEDHRSHDEFETRASSLLAFAHLHERDLRSHVLPRDGRVPPSCL